MRTVLFITFTYLQIVILVQLSMNYLMEHPDSSQDVQCAELHANIWDKVFKNEPSKICERQPFENLKGYGLVKQAVSHTLKQ